jgi:DNA-binding NarL/FixJ family response regulator
MAVRVSLLSGCPIVAEGFRTAISAQPEIEVASVFSSFAEFIAGVGQNPADVLLVDFTPDITVEQLWEILKRFPTAKTVLWLHTVPVSLAHSARKLGVRGILRKNASSLFGVGSDESHGGDADGT